MFIKSCSLNLCNWVALSVPRRTQEPTNHSALGQPNRQLAMWKVCLDWELKRRQWTHSGEDGWTLEIEDCGLETADWRDRRNWRLKTIEWVVGHLIWCICGAHIVDLTHTLSYKTQQPINTISANDIEGCQISTGGHR